MVLEDDENVFQLLQSIRGSVFVGLIVIVSLSDFAVIYSHISFSL